jgi:hypothetical protein
MKLNLNYKIREEIKNIHYFYNILSDIKRQN